MMVLSPFFHGLILPKASRALSVSPGLDILAFWSCPPTSAITVIKFDVTSPPIVPHVLQDRSASMSPCCRCYISTQDQGRYSRSQPIAIFVQLRFLPAIGRRAGVSRRTIAKLATQPEHPRK
ncbi:hypothetical protein PAXRUDRAFT_380226 [Paxillus rubicundulus Ve08.2h10]|uniref:Uncharacterized protein n=1 Tax=Paxillus rubicundulus Ve08.2h10 TaxID=930991 RepID=A0A0D0DYW0_9AGAM|nr:hypothetical protein PAXRUDRAFT_380226 [Paxillus rubicundulus Ve08.2h10]